MRLESQTETRSSSVPWHTMLDFTLDRMLLHLRKERDHNLLQVLKGCTRYHVHNKLQEQK